MELHHRLLLNNVMGGFGMRVSCDNKSLITKYIYTYIGYLILWKVFSVTFIIFHSMSKLFLPTLKSKLNDGKRLTIQKYLGFGDIKL